MKRGSSPSTRHRALYYVATPPPELAAWVECLWELSPGRRAGQLEVWEERIPAELGSDLVISLGTAYQHRVGNSSALVSGRHCLGVRQQPEHFIHRMSNHLVGIRLRPGAAAMLLRRHGADLQGRCELAEACFGELMEVVQRASELDTGRRGALITDDGVYAACREVVSRLRTRSAGPPRVSTVLRVMRNERLFRVGALCRRLGVTERTLERLFQAELGVRPKFAARVVRIQVAQQELRQGVAAARVACLVRFSDQSHLCNELKALAGATASGQVALPTVCRISPRRPMV